VIRVITFGQQAEPTARDLGAGSMVFVSGHLRQLAHMGRDGLKLRSLELVADRVEFLSEAVAHARETAFIDPPAVVADADPPAQVPESDPPSPDQ